MSVRAQSAILRSLCFHEAWSYVPTRVELIQLVDVRSDLSLTHEEIVEAIEALIQGGVIQELRGRVGLAASIERLVQLIEERDFFQPRKRRRAQLVARWLVRLSGVRAVAIANTTALGSARDEGDLDFFVITRAGTIWSTRFFAGVPFKLLGWLPTETNERDAVCLSYFIAESEMDLSLQMLRPDDPYFRHWFLSLLPLYDDGVLQELWDRNAELRKRHPFAVRWIVPPDLAVKTPWIRIPTRFAEPILRWIQMKWFPSTIRSLMNQDTRVMVNDQVLKFHVTDAREAYRHTYETLCMKYSINP